MTPAYQDLPACQVLPETEVREGYLAERQIAPTQAGEVILARKQTPLRVSQFGADGVNLAIKMESLEQLSGIHVSALALAGWRRLATSRFTAIIRSVVVRTAMGTVQKLRSL